MAYHFQSNTGSIEENGDGRVFAPTPEQYLYSQIKQEKQQKDKEAVLSQAEKRLKILDSQRNLNESIKTFGTSGSLPNNGMVGPSPTQTAFSTSHDFTDRLITSGSAVLSSKPTEESFLSYSYRMRREKLSFHESAPGSRWPQRLSAQRNCGFAGGGKQGFRRDAVNEEEEAGRARGRQGRVKRLIPVPQGLQDAVKRNIECGVDMGDDDDDVYYSAEEGDDQ